MIAQQRAVARRERCLQLLLPGFFQRTARQRLRPDGLHRSQPSLHISQIILHTVKLPIYGQGKLRRLRRRYAR